MTIACLCLFAVGAGLRLLLCWVNPPGNAFDNHYEPILMIIKTGVIPAKDAWYQCYHPPVFYISSALIGGTAEAAGMTLPAMVKLLCLFADHRLWSKPPAMFRSTVRLEPVRARLAAGTH